MDARERPLTIGLSNEEIAYEHGLAEPGGTRPG